MLLRTWMPLYVFEYIKFGIVWSQTVTRMQYMCIYFIWNHDLKDYMIEIFVKEVFIQIYIFHNSQNRRFGWVIASDMASFFALEWDWFACPLHSILGLILVHRHLEHVRVVCLARKVLSLLAIVRLQRAALDGAVGLDLLIKNTTLAILLTSDVTSSMLI